MLISYHNLTKKSTKLLKFYKSYCIIKEKGQIIMQMNIKGKKFYISIDLEGVACVVGNYGEGLGNGKNYNFAVEQAEREAIAAAKALLDNGADEIWIWDCHGTGVNLNYRSFPEKCKFVIGNGTRTRFPCIDESFGGILLIGYHAYDTPSSTLSHVYSSVTYQYMKINGEFVGEAQIDALFAARKGVPFIFAASDDICIDQIKRSHPDCYTVVTKKALAWNACISKHPDTVCHEIYTSVVELINKGNFSLPKELDQTFELEVRYKRIEYAQGCQYRNPDGTLFETVDAYTRKGILSNIDQLF